MASSPCSSIDARGDVERRPARGRRRGSGSRRGGRRTPPRRRRACRSGRSTSSRPRAAARGARRADRRRRSAATRPRPLARSATSGSSALTTSVVVGGQLADGGPPALGDVLELAVAVELVAEEVAEQRRRAGATRRITSGQGELVDLEQAELARRGRGAGWRRRPRRGWRRSCSRPDGASEPRIGGRHGGRRRLPVRGGDDDRAVRRGGRRERRSRRDRSSRAACRAASCRRRARRCARASRRAVRPRLDRETRAHGASLPSDDSEAATACSGPLAHFTECSSMIAWPDGDVRTPPSPASTRLRWRRFAPGCAAGTPTRRSSRSCVRRPSAWDGRRRCASSRPTPRRPCIRRR